MAKTVSQIVSGAGDFVRAKFRRLNAKGHEVPDPVPMAPPVGFTRSPSIAEQIRNMVRSERLRQEAEAAGMETFEEANDFEVDEDPESRSGYENDEDTPLEELIRRQKEHLSSLEAEKLRIEQEGAGAGTSSPKVSQPTGERSQTA